MERRVSVLSNWRDYGCQFFFCFFDTSKGTFTAWKQNKNPAGNCGCQVLDMHLLRALKSDWYIGSIYLHFGLCALDSIELWHSFAKYSQMRTNTDLRFLFCFWNKWNRFHCKRKIHKLPTSHKGWPGKGPTGH